MDPRRIVGSGVAAPPLPLGQRVEGSLGRWLVGGGLDQAGSNGAGPTPAAHEVDPAEQRRLEGERIEPPHAPLRVDPAQVDAVDEAALRNARERLADDAHVAALLAAGDPAAERAALALAINAGSWSRALVGLSQAVLHLERHVSRGLLRRS